MGRRKKHGGDIGRKRFSRSVKNHVRLGPNPLGWRNPYPWMSQPEAMVHLELERRRIPFSWRFFDGDSVHRAELSPEFHPEFTLKEYKIVIVVLGGFFGVIPSVLDKVALGIALLEADGWKCAFWTEAEIRDNVKLLMDKDFPELVRPAVVGAPRPNPYGIPDFMARRRTQLRGLALKRAYYALTNQERDASSSLRPRRLRRRFDSSDQNRRRIGRN